jgi:hypothetical protein
MCDLEVLFIQRNRVAQTPKPYVRNPGESKSRADEQTERKSKASAQL